MNNFNIKSVLSIIEFPNCNKKLQPLQDLYKDSETHIYKDDIIYQNLNIPDVENPSLLESNVKELNKDDLNEFERENYCAIEILTKSSIFINERLSYGSVLVHCEKGRRRSPTVVIAWLVSQGFNTNQAIKMIASNYHDNKNPSYDWGSKYRLTREKWISVIETWSKNFESYKIRWMKSNIDILIKWNNKINPTDILQLESSSKKRNRSDESIDEETPKKKVFKRVKKTVVKPTTWRNKKV